MASANLKMIHISKQQDGSDVMNQWWHARGGNSHLCEFVDYRDNNSHMLFGDEKIGEVWGNHGEIAKVLTGGSLMTDGRVTQNFRKEKMRSNNSNDGN
jgi:hypothetical protein